LASIQLLGSDKKICWTQVQHSLTIEAAPQPKTMIENSDPTTVLWYRQPADAWIKALPVGNGRLGAMVFGGPQSERLQLNDVSIWSGSPQPDADRKDAWKSLPELRRLIREGKYDEAAKFAEANFNGPTPYGNSYQTLGDLTFEFELPKGEVSDYQRHLDVGQAIAAVAFEAGGVNFKREVFSSAPDGVLVHKLTVDRPGALSFSMRLGRPERATTRFVAPDTLVMTGNTGDTVSYEVHVRVLHKGGTITGEGNNLQVAHADDVTVLLSCATTYVLDYDKGYKGGDFSLAAKRLQAAAAKPYEVLRAAHVADYRKYFDRVNLDTGKSELALPTDERLKAFGDGNADPGFAALFYNFGRYLLISSSRPDNPLPANLQGIWADGLNPPWLCDYHLNINLQMNYWPAESSNLSETHLPMLRLTQSLAKPGSKTAQAYFGPDTPGWVASYTTNALGWTSPGASLPWGIWFGGSAWMCQHLWEHYAFTRDREYLRTAYPTLKGAAEFWLASLVEGEDGKLIVSPSTSPENNFTTDSGMTSTIIEGAAMDQALVWDLLDNTAQAAQALGIDSDFRRKVEATRERLRPLQIGKAGQLMEWNGDWDMNAKDIHHRHVSHLYALHPGHQITMASTPALAVAAKKSLEIRGDDGTGWALAWKINFWARLHDGDRAFRLAARQLRYTEELQTVMAGAGGTYPNLFDAHPPFQIDGNFGFVSGINEMLLQSHERYTDPKSPNEDRYVIEFLPALPSTWPNGSVAGLRARGGFVIDMTWHDGKLEAATIRSVGGTTTRMRYGDKVVDLKLTNGSTKQFGPTFTK
jgi:alpha-L-fucosidase 2